MMLTSWFLITANYFIILCNGVATLESGCAPYDAGVVGESRACVCNSSYCDVIKRPPPLSRKRFHLYSTSKARPGFTHTTGAFGTDGPRNQDEVTITVNASLQYQEILGFGGSITDSVGFMFNTLPKGVQDNFIESYFGENGIEYSFLRVTIGSTDFSLRKYTLNDVPYDMDMTQFNLTEESFEGPRGRTIIVLFNKMFRIEFFKFTVD